MPAHLTRRFSFLLLLLIFGITSAAGPFKRKYYIASDTNKIELLRLDRKLLANLENYANELQNRIDILKSVVKENQGPIQAAKGREEEYMSNPLLSFPLLWKIPDQWEYVDNLLNEQLGKDEIEISENLRKSLPIQADVDRAADAVYRIQRIYDLNAQEMAIGLLQNVKYNVSLTPMDSYAIGLEYFEAESYKEAADWIELALDKQFYWEIYELMGLNRRKSEQLLVKVLLKLLDQQMQFNETRPEKKTAPKSHGDELQKFDSNYAESEIFERVCSGAFQPKISRLYCQYNRRTSPFLFLAPIKMEQLHNEPYIVIYHDVVSSAEATELERMSQDLLLPTTIYSAQLNRDIGSNSRTAEGAWLPHGSSTKPELAFLGRIERRIADMTGLALTELKFMQMLRYGFGGQYVPHWDYFNSTTVYTKDSGDRIATVLFYLNDVHQGGNTVFPYLNISVSPRRGNVLFWYNMDTSTYDFQTKSFHGSCPVIYGTKLVMTHWIHERPQMFIRPCYYPPQYRSYE